MAMDELPQRRVLPHDVPDFVADASVYFVTVCCAQRGWNQLCEPVVAASVFDSIEFNRQRGLWWPFLALLMPDHVHMLVSFPNDVSMKNVVGDWKQYLSREVGVVWQRGFFDHRIRSDESYDEKAYYIRMNPVRAGVVGDVGEWRYVREWGDEE